jgi:c-di-GMP-binding flagellar brake protein YcgR
VEDPLRIVSPAWLYGGIAVAGALLLLAVALEWARRKRAKRSREDASWNAAREVVQARGLPDGQWRHLKAAIEAWGPEEPHYALTVRRDFDRCVAAYLDQLDPAEAARAGAELRAARERLGLGAPPGSRRLYTTREIESGSALWLGEGEGAARVRATVLDVDEARLKVVPEMNLPPGLTVSEGAEVSCVMRRPDDGLYHFRLPVLAAQGKPMTLLLGHTDELHRTQQREYFRIRYDIETPITVVPKAAGEREPAIIDEDSAYSVRARLRDISAGGFSAVMQGKLPQRAWLMFNLDLSEEFGLDPDEPPPEEIGPVRLTARTVEIKPIAGDRQLIRGEFVGVDPDTRDLLARFVLQRQQRDLQQEEQGE